MKNFAIFNYSDIGKNQGGPSGYLYNLFQGMKEINKDITFFRVMQGQQNDSKIKTTNRSNPIVEEIRSILYLIKKGFLCASKVSKEIHNFTVIHVHSCEDVFYLRSFVKYKGNIILTSHRPESLVEEKVTSLKIKCKTKWSFPLLKLQLQIIEKMGYKGSQGFIFPSPGAMSIYNQFPGFKKYSKEKPIGYVFTGSPKKVPNISLTEYRRKLSLNAEDKMICYIGRHNYIKGYDLLTSIAKRFENNGINVVCAGANNLLPSPDSSNWTELGFVSDPFNLINASDIVVIPNRNTYFDLIIVEILSLGKIVVTSDSGGNLDISRHTKGLRLFKSGDLESLYNEIISTFELTNDEKSKIANENIEFYNKYCTLDRFATNYIKTISTVSNLITPNNIEEKKE